MKRLFIVLCDVMVVAMIITVIAGGVWGVTAWLKMPAAGPAKTVCIIAMVAAVASLIASYAVWARMPGDSTEDITNNINRQEAEK